VSARSANDGGLEVDREDIKAFIEEEDRPTVPKILGRFMLDPSEHHARIERVLRESTGSVVSAGSTEQVKITDGGRDYNRHVSVTSLLYGSSPPLLRGGRVPTPPKRGSGLTRTTSAVMEGSQ